MRRSVDFWYLRISRRASAPGRYRFLDGGLGFGFDAVRVEKQVSSKRRTKENRVQGFNEQRRQARRQGREGGKSTPSRSSREGHRVVRAQGRKSRSRLRPSTRIGSDATVRQSRGRGARPGLWMAMVCDSGRGRVDVRSPSPS